MEFSNVIKKSDEISKFMQQTTDLRMFLRHKVYSEYPLAINNLLATISRNFNLFNIHYNINEFKIELKIKKTDMKKNPQFKHDSSFYYLILNQIFFDVINPIIFNNPKIVHEAKLAGVDLSILSCVENMALIYQVTTLVDNIVIITL